MNWLRGFVWLLLVGSTSVNAEVLDIAHRGYAAVNPESTMLAFQRAHQQGADGIEFDVRQTQDGVVVVAHDPNIPALGNRVIENTSFSDVYMATDTPSLEEVLIFAKQSGQVIWLEIKQSHRYPGMIDRVLALIARYELQNMTVIQSFNPNDLRQINDRQPALKLLALYVNNFNLGRVAAYVDYVGLPMTNIYLNPSMIQRLHELGKQVIFWRRNEHAETKQVLQSFINAGADGFMLDRSLKAIMWGG